MLQIYILGWHRNTKGETATINKLTKLGKKSKLNRAPRRQSKTNWQDQDPSESCSIYSTAPKFFQKEYSNNLIRNEIQNLEIFFIVHFVSKGMVVHIYNKKFILWKQ